MTPTEDARGIWRWCFVRVQNLHTNREPPFLTMINAPSDHPAECHIQEELDRVSRERTRQALERAAGLIESQGWLSTEHAASAVRALIPGGK